MSVMTDLPPSFSPVYNRRGRFTGSWVGPYDDWRAFVDAALHRETPLVHPDDATLYATQVQIRARMVKETADGPRFGEVTATVLFGTPDHPDIQRVDG